MHIPKLVRPNSSPELLVRFSAEPLGRVETAPFTGGGVGCSEMNRLYAPRSTDRKNSGSLISTRSEINELVDSRTCDFVS